MTLPTREYRALDKEGEQSEPTDAHPKPLLVCRATLATKNFLSTRERCRSARHDKTGDGVDLPFGRPDRVVLRAGAGAVHVVAVGDPPGHHSRHDVDRVGLGGRQSLDRAVGGAPEEGDAVGLAVGAARRCGYASRVGLALAVHPRLDDDVAVQRFRRHVAGVGAEAEGVRGQVDEIFHCHDVLLGLYRYCSDQDTVRPPSRGVVKIWKLYYTTPERRGIDLSPLGDNVIYKSPI
ncbi:hypothetical protein A2592_01545 [Candidatus Kaiserbacteria bacterium RIFOXYD1_FULL_42_15]|uniref:Uncharacterized protein n=1 Tax=Candidatus Kaiserbacteria bacterium RIFOXYD1_FULL_42_15 TaxID=1798532 RepID=A0A1F6FPX2_9BACT|nr:MAG: hypothetical protein A2592_01545 [Candidatus Kaiserbacteria bacterium RIFOXYD1_FULL_42_15]